MGAQGLGVSGAFDDKWAGGGGVRFGGGGSGKNLNFRRGGVPEKKNWEKGEGGAGVGRKKLGGGGGGVNPLVLSHMLVKSDNFDYNSHDGIEIGVNSLWPVDAIWHHKLGQHCNIGLSMAWCVMAPSHYPNQCLLIISEDLWYSPESSFTGNAQSILDNNFNIIIY